MTDIPDLLRNGNGGFDLMWDGGRTEIPWDRLLKWHNEIGKDVHQAAAGVLQPPQAGDTAVTLKGYRTEDLDTLARTLYGECRSESREGKIAVAHVIKNRADNPKWWCRKSGDGIPDDTIEAVCRHPWQFSCWNLDDPNRPKLLAATPADKKFASAWMWPRRS